MPIGPTGSGGVRLGPMGSDWVISHTAKLLAVDQRFASKVFRNY